MKAGLAPRQTAILGDYLRNRPKLLILEGAVRSGKTVLNNLLFYLLVRSKAGRSEHYIMTGHTLGSIKRNVLDPMSEMFGADCKLDNNGMFGLHGNKVHCFGADKADSYKAITGMTAHGWYGNEMTLQHNNTIGECFARSSGPGAWALWDTNPDYPEHPIKIDHIDRSGERLPSGKLRVQSYHFQLEDNPYLPEDYIANLKITTPPGMWYDRRIKGLWVAAEGLVYELFNPAVHVIPAFAPPADWKRYAAVDFGFTNPFVHLWGATDEDGRLFIYNEHYQANMLIKDHAKAIHLGGVISNTVADHDAQERAELWEAGILTRPAEKDVPLGIQRVAERMVIQSDGRPRLFIMDNCKHLVSELRKYCWEERKEGRPAKEEPVKSDDHACDALRYMVMEIDSGRFILV